MSNQTHIDEVLEQKCPKLIFLAGKTSTGKTTLSKSLEKKYGYTVIELDNVIRGLNVPDGANGFIEAYLNRDYEDFTSSFVIAVKNQIEESLASQLGVIIEGALSNVETLKEIVAPWSESFLIIFLHPSNIESYKERLLSRFVLSSQDDGNGLPGSFWEKFTTEQLERYYVDRLITPDIEDVVTEFALESVKTSEARFAKLSNGFDQMLKIEV